MNRREAIKRTSILLGGTLSASAMMGVLNGCKAEPSITWAPEYFTTDEGGLVEAIVGRIIPLTDTPGAIEAGVPQFIDTMMAGFYQEKEKNTFREGLKKVEEDAKAAHGKPFAKLSEEEQDALLTKLDQAAFADGVDRGTPDFFRMAKELTVLGFCTSEAGATEFLKYEPVPGDYKGCIPYSEVGAAWATS
ncbi:MAG: gluconate 2-dehydrogenase subunit 3 family protein [Lewinellaceae bacterium]|nr:gluconate 2-dehydrogenase subunit 3 family protein [Saprospiraceae bacterium]MCB9338417.1 gluconate 2-dehydrogenase subunit 3 family protein [Lewinellaceae bacterium]